MAASKPLNECKVLCTPSTFGRRDPSLKSALEAAVGEVVYNPFGRALKAAEARPLVKNLDGYIAGLDEIDASVIAAADRLRIIARYGVGIDRVDVAAATDRGIAVTNTPSTNSGAVAELTVAFVLCLARNLITANAALRRGEWPVLDGIGIRGKTAGLVGFGAVGREVAKRLKCFDCCILTYDPYVGADLPEQYGVSLVPLEKLLSESDFVSLHAPATDLTIGMVNQEFIGRMKKGAFLINTARGELIDEAALVTALESGHLQAAALDCFSREPIDKDNPLLRLPQVVVTPHTAAHTDEAANRMGWTAIENCLAALRGEHPPNLVNPEVWEQRRGRKDNA